MTWHFVNVFVQNNGVEYGQQQCVQKRSNYKNTVKFSNTCENKDHAIIEHF